MSQRLQLPVSCSGCSSLPTVPDMCCHSVWLTVLVSACTLYSPCRAAVSSATACSGMHTPFLSFVGTLLLSFHE